MPRRTVFWTLAALAVVAAVVQAWVLRWTCDDAFISFRYAQHFVEGHGLVFNLDPTEAPVEGYTNFAWTMLLALGVAFGCTDRALETWAVVWGILAHAATVLLLARIAWRAGGGRALVPIAACGYAAMHHAASLAPAGLETAMFTLLVTTMLQRTIALRTANDAWLLGLIGVLAAMTRPDGAIPVAMAGLFVLHDARRSRSWRLLAAYVLPFVLVFLPYLLWRHAYYGQWVPNTFFAKSGDDPFVSQGFVYVRDFFVCYWQLLLALALLAVFTARASERRPWLAIAAFVGSYVAFVLWVGGDFMFARFLLPIVPALLLAFDLACARWAPAWPQVALAVIAVLGSVLRCEPAGLDNPLNAVSDNRRITFNEYVPGLSLFEAAHMMHPYLRELFAGLPVRIAIAGGHANFAYATHVPVAIECAAGLTDAHIARLPVAVRGKRGHDKPRDPAYLERRGVHFMLEASYMGTPKDPWRDVMFKPIGLSVRLVTWDRGLMAELRRRDPNIVVQDFEQYLDAYITDLPNKTKEQVRADFAEFRGFWFDHEPDPARRAAFETFLK